MLTPGESELRAVLERSREGGLLGPGPVTDHIEHARAFAAAVGEDFEGRGIDLGAGGGVPGLVLAHWYPRARWTLVDANLRRVRFLEEAVREMGVGERTSVVHGRAEQLGREEGWRGAADVVVARSFGPPAVVAECAAPLLRVGGVLVVSEPPAAEHDRWPTAGVERLGLVVSDVGERVGVQMASLRQVRTCPTTYPRRVGVPERRPLF